MVDKFKLCFLNFHQGNLSRRPHVHENGTRGNGSTWHGSPARVNGEHSDVPQPIDPEWDPKTRPKT